MRYSTCLISYLDVLGFKDIVGRSETVEQIYTILSAMHDKAGIGSYEREYVYQHLGKDEIAEFMFSDSLIRAIDVSCRLKTHNLCYYLGAEIYKIGCAQTLLIILRGTLLRGAISFGDLYFNTLTNIVFGPALINAYRLGENIALYPRIIIDPKIIKLAGGPAFFDIPCADTHKTVANDDIVGNALTHNAVRRDRDGLFYD